jgi:hypothetical protein
MAECSIGFYDWFALFSGFLYYSYGSGPLYKEVVLIQTPTECDAMNVQDSFLIMGFLSFVS